MLEKLLPLLFLTGLGVVVYRALVVGTYDVRIRCRRGAVTVDGRLTQGKTAKLQQFFADLAGERTLTVMYCHPRKGRRPPTVFRGPFTEAEKQQIRNYLMSEL